VLSRGAIIKTREVFYLGTVGLLVQLMTTQLLTSLLVNPRKLSHNNQYNYIILHYIRQVFLLTRIRF